MRSLGKAALGAAILSALAAGSVNVRTCFAGMDPLPVYQQALPDVALRSPSTGEVVRLSSVVARRPGVILVTDTSSGPSCPLARLLAAHQEEFAPWFSWTGVMSGACAPEGLAALHRSSPVRFENCLHDPAETLRTALGLERLPALLLVNEDGYVQAACAEGGGRVDPAELVRMLGALAAGSRRTRGTLVDFRLPRVGGGHASFLDVAGRDFTVLSFLHTGCHPCARELEVLDYLRDRSAGGASLVTVFLDDAREERVAGYLGAAGVRPDAVLRDPDLRLASAYRITAVPALLVVDARGRIVYSRRGYREEERDSLYRELSATLGAARADAAGAGRPAPVDARRIRTEAEAFLRQGKPEFALLYLERLHEIMPACHSAYLLMADAALAAGRPDLALRSLARYLAADPLAYDRAEVRGRMAELLAGTP